MKAGQDCFRFDFILRVERRGTILRRVFFAILKQGLFILDIFSFQAPNRSFYIYFQYP